LEDHVGLFWDLIQQSQISDQRNRATTLEMRVAALERDLAETQRRMRTLMERLETRLGADIDGDGRVG
jgi:uncharacterized coiled-coil protein SlyX